MVGKKILLEISNAADVSFKRTYKPIIYILALSVFGVYVWQSVNYAYSWNGWTVGDWLINYSNGFVRRGLFGWAIIELAETTQIPMNYLVSAVHIASCAVFFVILLKLVRVTEVSYWRFFLLTSPGFLLFYFLDGAAVGRKEMLLFSLFSGWVLLLKKSESPPSHFWRFAFSVAGGLFTLAHELFAFFTIYFALAWYLKYGSVREAIFKTSPIQILSLMALVFIVFFGGDVSNPTVCQALVDRGANESVCQGIMSWPISAAGDAYIKFTSTGSISIKLAAIFFSALIAFLPIYIFLVASGSSKKNLAMSLAFAAFFISLPLYVTAIDWGRWTHIHFVLFTLTLFLIPEGIFSGVIAPPFKRASLAAFGLLVISTSLLWRIGHCCEASSFDPRAARVMTQMVKVKSKIFD